MVRRIALLFALALLGCSHSQTVVHLSAPVGGAWSVNDTSGARLCALPCRVELDADEAVVVTRDGSTRQFVVQQRSIGAGTWNGSIRWREEPSDGALAVRAFSTSLVNAGSAIMETRKDSRIAAAVVLSGLGALGMAAASALPSRRHEELWLERAAP